jgi:uncharacterized protein with PQ loop repeat
MRKIFALPIRIRNRISAPVSTVKEMLQTDFLLLATVAGANVLGVGMLVPQAWRSLTTRNLDGVSAAWIGTGLAINIGWTAYGLAAGVAGLLPVSLGSLALYGAIAATARMAAPHFLGRMLRTGLVVLATLTAAALLGRTDGLGLALAALYTVQFAPAALAALTSTSLDGVAPSTWFMSLTEAALWCVYGVAIGDLALILGGAGAGVTSAVVCCRVAWVAGTGRPPARPQPVIAEATSAP